MSACLCGKPVRYDGEHQAQGLLTSHWQHIFKFQEICPETSIGMSVPRPPIQLVGTLDQPEAIGKQDNSLRPSLALRQLGKNIQKKMPDISGFILKSRSPSCGVGSTKVITPQGTVRSGTGLFAEQLILNQPGLPIIEETGLNQRSTRLNFLSRVFFFRRWQDAFLKTHTSLADFHQRHHLTYLCHGPEFIDKMSALTQQSTQNYLLKANKLFQQYPATPVFETVVLKKILKKLELSIDQTQLINEMIEKTYEGQLSVQYPRNLLSYYSQLKPTHSLNKQYFLNPRLEEQAVF